MVADDNDVPPAGMKNILSASGLRSPFALINKILIVFMIFGLVAIWVVPLGHVFYSDDGDGGIWYDEYLWSDLELLILYLPLLLGVVLILFLGRYAILNWIVLLVSLVYFFITGMQFALPIQDFNPSYGGFLMLLLAVASIIKTGLNLFRTTDLGRYRSIDSFV